MLYCGGGGWKEKRERRGEEKEKEKEDDGVEVGGVFLRCSGKEVVVLSRVKTKISERPDRVYPWLNAEMRLWLTDMGELESFRERVEFFRDFLTDSEMRMLAQRWHIARELVRTKDSHGKIAVRVEASPTTVGAVAKQVYLGIGGLMRLLEKTVIDEQQREYLEKRGIEMRNRYGGSYSHVAGYFR